MEPTPNLPEAEKALSSAPDSNTDVVQSSDAPEDPPGSVPSLEPEEVPAPPWAKLVLTVVPSAVLVAAFFLERWLR